MNSTTGWTIGKIAKAAQVNIQTLRYYERIGLLKPSSRRTSGYRLYDADAVRALRFIKHAQELGFSLEEIKKLLDLKADKKSQCEKVRSRALKQLEGVRSKIERLVRIQKVIEDLTNRCAKKKVDEGCPILECLDEFEFEHELGVKAGGLEK